MRVPLSFFEADKVKLITIGLYIIHQSQTQIAQHRHAVRLADEAEGDEAEDMMEPKVQPAVRPPP